MAIGWFGEDAWDFVSDRVDDLGAGVRALPGGSELLDAAQDFAKTPTGLVVMRAFSSMLYGSVAWAIGPQLAAVTFAVPGLFRGERFEEAWLTEFKWRVEKTAETLGPGVIDIFGAQLKDTLLRLADEVGAGALVDMGVQELAARFNIREDVAAFALSIWNRVQPPPRDAFDPVTGKRRGTLGKRSTSGTSTMTPCEAYRHYLTYPSWEQIPAVRDALKAKCGSYAVQQATRGSLDASRDHTTSYLAVLFGGGAEPEPEPAPVDVAIAVEEPPPSNTGNYALAAAGLAAVAVAYAWYRKLL